MIVKQPVEAFTVEELKNALEKLCEKGLGKRLVLIPNPFTEEYTSADYVSIREIYTYDESDCVIYLNENYYDDERYLDYDNLSPTEKYNVCIFPNGEVNEIDNNHSVK